MGKENREVKNNVLVDLMYEDESAEENERSFYNALHEEKLPENTEIKKVRVDNILYMNFIHYTMAEILWRKKRY